MDKHRNKYGYVPADFCRRTGLPMLTKETYGQYADIWLSASRCKRIRRPVKEGEAPVAWYKCQNGYCPLYKRDKE